MSKITHDTYEQYYLDYLEGNLNDSLRNDFEEFLSQNPDLRVENEITVLPPDQIQYNPKQKALLKSLSSNESINAENVEMFMIADLEGELSYEKKRELIDFISRNKKYQKDQELFAKTVLAVPEHLGYLNKKNLKKSVIRPIWLAIPAAAVLLGVILVLPMFTNAPITLQNGLKSSAYIPKKTIKSPHYSAASIAEVSTFTKQRAHILTPKSESTKEGISLDAKAIALHKIVFEPQIAELEIRSLEKRAAITNASTESVQSTFAMKNEMKLVSRVLGDLIKQEVVIQKGVSSEQKRQRVLFKIGTLEFSSNRSMNKK